MMLADSDVDSLNLSKGPKDLGMGRKDLGLSLTVTILCSRNRIMTELQRTEFIWAHAPGSQGLVSNLRDFLFHHHRPWPGYCVREQERE